MLWKHPWPGEFFLGSISAPHCRWIPGLPTPFAQPSACPPICLPYGSDLCCWAEKPMGGLKIFAQIMGLWGVVGHSGVSGFPNGAIFEKLGNNFLRNHAQRAWNANAGVSTPLQHLTLGAIFKINDLLTKIQGCKVCDLPEKSYFKATVTILKNRQKTRKII